MSDSNFNEILGDVLVNPSDDYKEVKTSDALAGKEVVMLYFSAHWCPPCRRFTPVLIELYNALKKSSTSMELVFVSYDKSEEEFKDYSSTMPWLCTVLDEKNNRTIGRKYKANGIPHLVVLDGTSGEVITMQGTEEVKNDEKGANFPWRPKPFSQIFPDNYLSTDNEKVSYSSIKKKHLMLYFSAHWCPPCQAFTPVLSQKYSSLKKSTKGDDFELLFISSDKVESSFQEYFQTMSFCALPFEYRDVKSKLSSLYEVSGIPKLIMLGPEDEVTGDRKVINSDVRSIVEHSDDLVNDFPFYKKNYGNLEINADAINDGKVVIVFHEGGDDEEQEEVKDVLKKVAEKSEKEFTYLWSFETNGLGGRVRSAMNLTDISEEPTIVLLDFLDDGAYYISGKHDFDFESILKFAKNPGTRLQLR